MKRGEDTMMPNWLLDAIENMTLASDIKIACYLGRRRLYQASTFKPWQIAGELGIDLRTTQMSLKRLADSGHILSTDGEHCLRGACAKIAHPLHKSTRVKTTLKTVQHEKNLSLNKENKGNKEEGRKEGENGAIVLPAEPAHPTHEHQEGESLPSPVLAPVQERIQSAVQGARIETAAPHPPQFRAAPPSPRPEHHGDDHDAVVLFRDIAGGGFVTRYRGELARWHRDYSEAFLRLAYVLAPTLPGSKGMFVFADLLDRDARKPWPEALKAQYELDVQAAAPAQTVPVARVKAGDLLRWPDGVIARVERVDHADAVTDAEDDARGYVPLALIGKTVEVLRA
ncbi:hypothetical protein ACFFLM_04585 [Deinococcus oregonensis]|uniref:Helix-turn-helix domain-containing protein n=1 Tax=Deinococcus oregonensis TaxID=1805970 RepID=A0ABV6AXC2_9DEIO